jgi:MYXO-CTERM domain-containing protein
MASLLAVADDARACGGCFHGPTQNGDVITDHRMIFRVTPQQTTLYDEIEYQGNPQSFAWVLPIHGQVQVGLSADVLFAALDQATATTIQSPQPPPCPSCGCYGGADAGVSFGAGGGSSSGGSNGGGVNVISQSVVGPYDTVQLSSTNPTALTDWLTANGFAIPSDIDPIIAAYVNEGFDFLALKLQPGQGVQAMRPVRVTTQGAGLSLPLRMVAAGTGATVGITLWVIADGRYEAANFGNFLIQPSQIVWDFSTETSNYTTLRQQIETSANFATWQTESSLDVTPYQIEDSVLAGTASTDYLPIDASDGGSAGETADQVRQDDLATVFPGGNQGSVRITRMRADLAHAALANDLNLQASSDQSDVSNLYNVTEFVNAPACPAVPNPCPPCGGGSGGFGSTSGGSYGGSSSGSGTSTSAASPGQSTFGCSTSPTDASGGWLEAALAGILGLGFVRSRARRKR